MAADQIQLCRGLKFLVTDMLGNINEHSFEGFYFKDTRHLNLYKLLVENTLLQVLTSKKVSFNSSTCVLTNSRTDNLPEHILSVIRTQTLDEGLNDSITCLNNGEQDINFDLDLQFNTDFADIFEVKHLYLDKGNKPIKTRTIQKTADQDTMKVAFRYQREDFKRVTSIHFDKSGSLQDWSLRLHIRLKPKERYTLTVNTLLTETKNVSEVIRDENEHFPAQDFNAMHLIPPNLETDWHDLSQIYKKSLYDLASLRVQTKLFKNRPSNLPAAGLPWFMAMFGRDSLITAYQTLMLDQDLALGTIDRLAYFQGKEVNIYKEEAPGKILHEIRFGEYAHFQEWVQFPYYGTVDATPLFLILISEVYRWLGDEDLVNHYRTHIEKALQWIDIYGDLDKDGFVEYIKQTPMGLENQNWRDSWDSMAFNNGSEGEPPIASADVQGYVYDAKKRIAEIARDVWKDKKMASRLEKEAETLKKNFNKAFFVTKGKYFALGLDKNKKHIDSLSSCLGQLLWSGIVEDNKVQYLVKHLESPELYSGWGVRTIGTSSKAYNPIGYHVGTVWPHDNSLIVKGLKDVHINSNTNNHTNSNIELAIRIIEDMITASSYFDYRLPEVFAGYERSSTPFPVQYPTASSPQAWAAGTAIIFLQTLLGITPDPKNQTIRVNPTLPPSASYIRLDGLSAFGKRFFIEVTKQGVIVEEVEKFTCFICKEKVTDGHKHT